MEQVIERVTPGTFDALQCAVACQSIPGEFWECGIYDGYTSLHLIRAAQGRPVRLFDSMRGRPERSRKDFTFLPQPGYADAVYDTAFWQRIDGAVLYPGFIPQTFGAPELQAAQIAFAYIDLDLYEGIRDALVFILPRLSPGGMALVHDYQHDQWPGVKVAVDECGWPFEALNHSALFRGKA